MKILKWFICSILIFGFQFNSNAEGLYFSMGIGGGDLEIQPEFLPGLIPTLSDADGAALIDVLAGYEFSNGLFVDIGVEAYSTINIVNLFDVASASSTQLSIGYTIPNDSRFKFYGKTGLNFWDLTLKEGIFLNPGPEELIQGSSGQDPFFQIGTDYHLNERIRFGLNYSYSDTEFGETSGAKITFKWFPWGR